LPTDYGSPYGARHLSVLFLLLPFLFLGCATKPPEKSGDICEVFREKDDWFDHSKAAEKRWGVPVPVQMAILYHESGYRDDARPSRRYLLGFIPWSRPSSAYGYAQAVDGTWEWYQREAGNKGADRDDFEDAADFVGWYLHKARRRFGISEWDARRHYLAYHEGLGGYARGSYHAKPELLVYARKVAATAQRYRVQLRACEAELTDSGSWWPF
jgi:hypothetical protein